jgi:hypothetical protein
MARVTVREEGSAEKNEQKKSIRKKLGLGNAPSKGNWAHTGLQKFQQALGHWKTDQKEGTANSPKTPQVSDSGGSGNRDSGKNLWNDTPTHSTEQTEAIALVSLIFVSRFGSVVSSQSCQQTRRRNPLSGGSTQALLLREGAVPLI